MSKEWTIRPGNWAAALADVLDKASDGDTIVVHSESMRELAERAAARRGARVVFRVEAQLEEPEGLFT